MAENENLESVSQHEQLADNAELIEALTEMNKTHVKKELYDRMKAERDQLISAVVKGEQVKVKEEEKPDINKLRKNLFSNNAGISNIEYWDSTLKLRNALIEAGHPDPFMSTGDKSNPYALAPERAEAVAQVMQECLDLADGDPGIFIAEQQRRTKDTSPMYRR